MIVLVQLPAIHSFRLKHDFTEKFIKPIHTHNYHLIKITFCLSHVLLESKMTADDS